MPCRTTYPGYDLSQDKQQPPVTRVTNLSYLSLKEKFKAKFKVWQHNNRWIFILPPASKNSDVFIIYYNTQVQKDRAIRPERLGDSKADEDQTPWFPMTLSEFKCALSHAITIYGIAENKKREAINVISINYLLLI